MSKFIDGPCMDQDCPNAGWPHHASDDLESMTPVTFSTQDVPAQIVPSISILRANAVNIDWSH